MGSQERKKRAEIKFSQFLGFPFDECPSNGFPEFVMIYCNVIYSIPLRVGRRRERRSAAKQTLDGNRNEKTRTPKSSHGAPLAIPRHAPLTRHKKRNILSENKKKKGKRATSRSALVLP